MYIDDSARVRNDVCTAVSHQKTCLVPPDDNNKETKHANKKNKQKSANNKHIKTQGAGTHYRFSNSHIDSLIRSIESAGTNWQPRERIAKHVYTTLRSHIASLRNNTIYNNNNNSNNNNNNNNGKNNGKNNDDNNNINEIRVVVFGASEPLYEAIAIACGADYVMTIDYNKLTYNHPKVRCSSVSLIAF